VVRLLALATLYAYIQGAVFFDLGLHRGRPDADALTRLLPFLPLLYIASFVLLIRRAVWVSIVNGVLLIAMGCAALLMWGADTGPAAAPSQTVRSLIAAQPIYLLVLMWMAMQRRQAEAAQQSAIRSKLTLLGMISHELRSPLQTIVASIELLAVRFKTSQASDVEYAALLRIRSAATQLGSHVRDLIEFTKMEAGSSQPHTGRFRLDDVLDDLVDEYAEEALDRGNHLSLEVADDCHDVVGDELRLRQIVNNLVSNAVKYTSGGSIVVSAKRAGPISDTIELRVADSGIGISQGKIEEIWKPYTRLEGDARVKSVKGTGLGLSVVRLLVSMLSGEIQIKSEQGAGTTITVLLPLPIASGGGR
jgi:signal transduction histidine kinase